MTKSRESRAHFSVLSSSFSSLSPPYARPVPLFLFLPADPSPSAAPRMLRRSKQNGVCVPVAALRWSIDIAAHNCFIRLKEIIRRGTRRGALTSYRHMGGRGRWGIQPLNERETWGSHTDMLILNTCSCICTHECINVYINVNSSAGTVTFHFLLIQYITRLNWHDHVICHWSDVNPKWGTDRKSEAPIRQH